MKKILYVSIIIIMITSIFILPKKVHAIENVISSSKNDLIICKPIDLELEKQQEWEEKYLGKIEFLGAAIYVTVAILGLNVLLFSILLYKNKKVDLIYKILQIIILLLMIVLSIILSKIPTNLYTYRTMEYNIWRDDLRLMIIPFCRNRSNSSPNYFYIY